MVNRTYRTGIGFAPTFSKTTSDLYSPKHRCECGHANCHHGRRIGKCYFKIIDAEGFESNCGCLQFRPVGARA